MKKAVVLLLALSLILNTFVLSGCGENSEQQDMGKIEFKEFTNDDVTFENDELFIKNQLLITADEKISYSDVEKAVGNYGGKIVGCIEFTNDYQVEFENADYDKLTEIKSGLSTDLPDSEITLHNAYTVNSASKDYKRSYTNDYSTKDGNWWRHAIQLTDLESKNFNYQTVKVGLIDTLFDTQNPDLSEYFVRDGVLYNDESKMAEEADSSHGNHGTNVTGFLAAKKGNGKGIDGVANNVKLYGYAISGNAGKENTFSSHESSSMHNKYQIACLLSKGVKIINISLGSEEGLAAAALNIRQAQRDLNTYSESMETFLKKYIDHGKEFIIVKAAGNENGETYVYCKEGVTKEHPYGTKCYSSKTDGNLSDYEKCSFIATADLDEFGAIEVPDVKNRIIMVGSSTKDNNRANHSVCGERVDIYAPGQDMTKLVTGEKGDGTSFAAPIVSGVVALMWGINPDISANDIKYIIKSQATKQIINEIGQTESYKFLINANNAVEYAKNFNTTITWESGKNMGKLLGYVRKLNDNQEIEEIGSSCDVSIYKGNDQETYAALTKPGYQEPVAYTHLTTDINGEFDLDLPEGDYYLSAKYNNGEYESVIKTFSIIKGEVCYLDDIILSKKTSSQSTSSNNDNSNTSNIYHNEEYGWSVKIPDAWYQYGIVKESETKNSTELGAVGFYYKEAYEANHIGHVFTIYAMPKDSANDDGRTGRMPAGGFLGRNSQYAFYYWDATDVQYDSNNERQRNEYRELDGLEPIILESFVLENQVNNLSWKTIYNEHLNSLNNGNNSFDSFSLLDIDKNGIPELLEMSTSVSNGFVCYICDGELMKQDIVGTIKYRESTKEICAEYAMSKSSFIKGYVFENGKLIQPINGNKMKFSDDNVSCFWWNNGTRNNDKVSEAMYEAKKAEYLNGFSDVQFISKENILKMIDNS